MTLPIKILIAGIVLAVVTVAIGGFLYYQAESEIPSMLKDCSKPKDDFDVDKERKRIRDGGYLAELTDQRVYAEWLLRWYDNNHIACDSHNNQVRDIPVDRLIYAGVTAGGILAVSALTWFFMIALPRAWNFLLQRIREVSKAITGK